MQVCVSTAEVDGDGTGEAQAQHSRVCDSRSSVSERHQFRMCCSSRVLAVQNAICGATLWRPQDIFCNAEAAGDFWVAGECNNKQFLCIFRSAANIVSSTSVALCSSAVGRTLHGTPLFASPTSLFDVRHCPSSRCCALTLDIPFLRIRCVREGCDTELSGRCFVLVARINGHGSIALASRVATMALCQSLAMSTCRVGEVVVVSARNAKRAHGLFRVSDGAFGSLGVADVCAIRVPPPRSPDLESVPWSPTLGESKAS